MLYLCFMSRFPPTASLRGVSVLSFLSPAMGFTPIISTLQLLLPPSVFLCCKRVFSPPFPPTLGNDSLTACTEVPPHPPSPPPSSLHSCTTPHSPRRRSGGAEAVGVTVRCRNLVLGFHPYFSPWWVTTEEIKLTKKKTMDCLGWVCLLYIFFSEFSNKKLFTLRCKSQPTVDALIVNLTGGAFCLNMIQNEIKQENATFDDWCLMLWA